MSKLKFIVAAVLAPAAMAWGSQIIGPTGTVYLSDGYSIYGVTGSPGGLQVTSWQTAYSFDETPIAVGSAIRTIGGNPGTVGGQYSLNGTPLHTYYQNPSNIGQFWIYDGTTDGVYNYFVATRCTGCNESGVYRTYTDWTNPQFLFTAGSGSPFDYQELGITYDPYNQSLWVADYNSGTKVRDYSMNGTLIDSFDAGHGNIEALAFDPADGTLWFGTYGSNVYEQWSSRAGNHVPLQTIQIPELSAVNSIHGAEFGEVPEPATAGFFLIGLALIGVGLKAVRTRR